MRPHQASRETLRRAVRTPAPRRTLTAPFARHRPAATTSRAVVRAPAPPERPIIRHIMVDDIVDNRRIAVVGLGEAGEAIAADLAAAGAHVTGWDPAVDRPPEGVRMAEDWRAWPTGRVPC